MKSLYLLIAGLALLLACDCAFAQAGKADSTKPPEVDAAEALRRGNTVRVVGEGPRGAAEEAIVAATAPPPDDSHMWYVTLFISKNAASSQLRKDFETDPNLAALVRAPENTRAWAHYNVYDVEDATQADRLKRYKLRDAKGVLVTPVVVVQPPRNGMWGDCRIVVCQQADYDGNPKALATKISGAVKFYAAKMSEQGYPKQIVSHYNPGGARQSVESEPPLPIVGYDPERIDVGARQVQSQAAPPFSTPQPVNPFNAPQPPAPNQWPDANPNIPTSFPPTPATTPATPSGASWLSQLAGYLFSPGSALIVVIILQAAHLYVRMTATPVDDKVLTIVEGILKRAGVINDEPKDPSSPAFGKA